MILSSSSFLLVLTRPTNGAPHTPQPQTAAVVPHVRAHGRRPSRPLRPVLPAPGEMAAVLLRVEQLRLGPPRTETPHRPGHHGPPAIGNAQATTPKPIQLHERRTGSRAREGAVHAARRRQERLPEVQGEIPRVCLWLFCSF